MRDAPAIGARTDDKLKANATVGVPIRTMRARKLRTSADDVEDTIWEADDETFPE